MFDLIYAGESARQHGVYVVSRPTLPVAQESITGNTTIPGRVDGLVERSGSYEDVSIAVDLNFVSKTEFDWTQIWRDCQLWLRKEGDLKFSDDTAVFYRVRYVTIGENERAIKRIGRFTATFVCRPGVYLETGQEWYDLTADGTDGVELTNYYTTSTPVYVITGNGACTLTVNGNTFSMTVDGSCTVDTDLLLCYKDAQTNVKATGDYDGLWLVPGLNTVKVSEGFTLRMRPNWRIV